jgi:magnesium transporter
MPLNFIVGFYGMNFANLPFLHWSFGYDIVLVFMIVVAVLTYMWMRKKRIIKNAK